MIATQKAASSQEAPAGGHPNGAVEGLGAALAAPKREDMCFLESKGGSGDVEAMVNTCSLKGPSVFITGTGSLSPSPRAGGGPLHSDNN